MLGTSKSKLRKGVLGKKKKKNHLGKKNEFLSHHRPLQLCKHFFFANFRNVAKTNSE